MTKTERENMDTEYMVDVSVVFDNDPENTYKWFIGFGHPDEFSHDDDRKILYYVKDMAELDGLRNPGNGKGWRVVKVGSES